MTTHYFKTKKLLLIGENLLIFFLLSITPVAIGTYWLWNNHKEWVNKADNAIVYKYLLRYSSRLKTAKDLLRDLKTIEATDILEEVVSDMGNVRKQDRLASGYIRAMKMLLFISRKQGDTKRSLELSEKLIQFNQNNYRYWLEYAKALIENAKREESINALYRAYRIAPYSEEVVLPLSGILYEDLKKEEALQVIQGYLNTSFKEKAIIEVFWASQGKNFSGKRKSKLTTLIKMGKKQSVSLPVNASNVEKLRFDFPGRSYLLLKVLNIRIITTEGKQEIDSKKTRLYLHDLDRLETDQESLSVTGKDPYIYFTVPPSLSNKNLITAEIELLFKRKIPPALKAIIRNVTKS